MPAGSIVIDLLMKTGAFETDTKRAEKRLRELKKEAEQVGKAVGVAFAALGAAASYMVKSTIDSMDEMSKMAQKVGTSTESLSALAYAADLAGVGQQELGAAMVKLSKNMSDAAMGTGEAEKGFKALGLSVKNTDGTLKSTDQMLSEVAAKFAGYKDGAEKTALAVNLFGKAGADLIPLLNGGADGLELLKQEAQRLGIVLDTESGKAAEEFNDNLTRMRATVTGLTMELSKDLLPALNDVLTAMREGSLLGFLTTGGNQTSSPGAALADINTKLEKMKKLRDELDPSKSFANKLNDFVFGDVGDLNKQIGLLEKQRSYLQALQRSEVMRGIGDTSDAHSRRLASNRTAAPRLKEDGPKGKDQDADFKAYLNNLQQQIQKTHELGAVEKLLDDIRRGSLTVSEKQKDQLLSLAQTIDKEKEHAELLKIKREAATAAGDAINKANEEYQALLTRLLDGGPAAQLEKQRKEMMLLADAFMQGRISAEQFNDAATGALGLNVTPALEKAKSMTEELGLTFASAFEEAALGGGKLSDVFKGLLQDLARVILRLGVIEPMMKKLKDSMDSGGAVSSVGNFLSNAISSFFGGARADGGPVSASKAYLVGERGPELFVPRTAGAIVPNQSIAGGGLTIINQTTGRIDRRQDRRSSNGDRVLVLEEVAAALSDPNSQISRAMGRNYNAPRRRS